MASFPYSYPLLLSDLLYHNPSKKAVAELTALRSFKDLSVALGGSLDEDLLKKRLWNTLPTASTFPPIYMRATWINEYGNLLRDSNDLIDQRDMLRSFDFKDEKDFKAFATKEKAKDLFILWASWFLIHEEEAAETYFRTCVRDDKESPQDFADWMEPFPRFKVDPAVDLPDSALTVKDLLFDNPFPKVAAKLSQQVTFQLTFRLFLAEMPPSYAPYTDKLGTYDQVKAFLGLAPVKLIMERADWPEKHGMDLHTTIIPSIRIKWIREYRDFRRAILPSFEKVLKALDITDTDLKELDFEDEKDGGGGLTPRDRHIVWCSYFYLKDQKSFADFVAIKREAELAQQVDETLCQYKRDAEKYVKSTTASGMKTHMMMAPQHGHDTKERTKDNHVWLNHLKKAHPAYAKVATKAESVLLRDEPVGPIHQGPIPSFKEKGTTKEVSALDVLAKIEAPLIPPVPSKVQAIGEPLVGVEIEVPPTQRTVPEGILVAKALVNNKGRLVFRDLEPALYKRIEDAMTRDGFNPEVETIDLLPSDAAFHNAARNMGYAIPPYMHTPHFRYFERTVIDPLTRLNTVFECFQKARFYRLVQSLKQVYPQEPLSQFLKVCVATDDVFKQQVDSRTFFLNTVARIQEEDRLKTEERMKAREGALTHIFMDEFVATADTPYRYLILDHDLAKTIQMTKDDGSQVHYELLFEKDHPARFAKALNAIQTEIPSQDWSADWFGLAAQVDYEALSSVFDQDEEKGKEQESSSKEPEPPVEEPPTRQKRETAAGFSLRYANDPVKNVRVYEYVNFQAFTRLLEAQAPVHHTDSDDLPTTLHSVMDKRLWLMRQAANASDERKQLAQEDPVAFFLGYTFAHLETMDVTDFGLAHGQGEALPPPFYNESFRQWLDPTFTPTNNLRIRNSMSWNLCYESMLLTLPNKEAQVALTGTLSRLSKGVLEGPEGDAEAFSAHVPRRSALDVYLKDILQHAPKPASELDIFRPGAAFRLKDLSFYRKELLGFVEGSTFPVSLCCLVVVQKNVLANHVYSLTDYFESVLMLEEDVKRALVDGVLECPFTKPAYQKEDIQKEPSRFISFFLRLPEAHEIHLVDFEDLLLKQQQMAKVTGLLIGMPVSGQASDPYGYLNEVVRHSHAIVQSTSPRDPLANVAVHRKHAQMVESSSSSSSSSSSVAIPIASPSKGSPGDDAFETMSFHTHFQPGASSKALFLDPLPSTLPSVMSMPYQGPNTPRDIQASLQRDFGLDAVSYASLAKGGDAQQALSFMTELNDSNIRKISSRSRANLLKGWNDAASNALHLCFPLSGHIVLTQSPQKGPVRPQSPQGPTHDNNDFEYGVVAEDFQALQEQEKVLEERSDQSDALEIGRSNVVSTPQKTRPLSTTSTPQTPITVRKSPVKHTPNPTLTDLIKAGPAVTFEYDTPVKSRRADVPHLGFTPPLHSSAISISVMRTPSSLSKELLSTPPLVEPQIDQLNATMQRTPIPTFISRPGTTPQSSGNRYIYGRHESLVDMPEAIPSGLGFPFVPPNALLLHESPTLPRPTSPLASVENLQGPSGPVFAPPTTPSRPPGAQRVLFGALHPPPRVPEEVEVEETEEEEEEEDEKDDASVASSSSSSISSSRSSSVSSRPSPTVSVPLTKAEQRKKELDMIRASRLAKIKAREAIKEKAAKEKDTATTFAQLKKVDPSRTDRELKTELADLVKRGIFYKPSPTTYDLTETGQNYFDPAEVEQRKKELDMIRASTLAKTEAAEAMKAEVEALRRENAKQRNKLERDANTTEI